MSFKNASRGLPWMVQRLRFHPSNAGQGGSISFWKQILHASWPKHQNLKQKQYGNKSNKDFKKMVLSAFLFKSQNVNFTNHCDYQLFILLQ